MRGCLLLVGLVACSSGRQPAAVPAPGCDASAELAAARAARGDGYLGRALDRAIAADEACESEATRSLRGELQAALWLDRPAVRSDATDDDRARAALLYRDAVVARGGGDHDGALERLEASYELAPHPLTLVQVGLTHRAAGREGEARMAFARALAAAEKRAGSRAQPEVVSAHPDRVSRIAMLGDGKTVATGGPDGVWLWSRATGRPTGRIEIEKLSALAAGGDRILTVGDDGVQLWSPAGARVATVTGAAHPATIDARGTLVAARADGSWKVIVADAATGAEVGRVPVAHYPIAIALSPDGRWLAAIGAAQTTVWHVVGGALLHSFPTQMPTTGSFSPDGSKLFVTSSPASVFDLTTGETMSSWKHMIGGYWVGDDTLILVRADGRLARFDLGMPEPRGVASVETPVVTAFDPIGGTLAVSSGNGVQLLDAELAPIRRWSFGAARVGPIAASPDGRTIFFGLGHRRYGAWRPATEPSPRMLGASPTMRARAAVDPSGRFGVAMSGFEARLWRLDDGAGSVAPDAPGFALTGDGRLILADREWRLASIDVARCIEVAPPKGCAAADLLAPDSPVDRTVDARASGYTGSYWPDFAIGVAGELLAVQRDRGFDLVDLRGPVRRLRVTAGATPGSLAIDPAGKVVARTDHDRVRLWELPGGRELPDLPAADMRAVWLSGDRVIVASDNQTAVEAYDWKRRKRLWRRELGQPTRYAPALAGRYLLRPNLDRAIALIDLATGEIAARLWMESPDSWLIVAADGRVDSSPEPPPMLSWRAGEVVLPGFVGLQRQRADLRRELFAPAR